MAIHHLSITLPSVVDARVQRATKPIRSLPERLAEPAHLPVMNTHDLGLEPLMGVEELAEYLGVPVQTIYDWRVSGTAPRAFKFGKRLKFAVSDVQGWLVAHQEATR